MFQSSTRKLGEKLQTKLCPLTDRWVDRQTDSHGDSSIPPPLRCGGIINTEMSSLQFKSVADRWTDSGKTTCPQSFDAGA